MTPAPCYLCDRQSWADQPLQGLSLPDPLQKAPCPWGVATGAWEDKAWLTAAAGWSSAPSPPPLFCLSEQPSPFCLIRTCSAGDVAGSHMPPCGSKQSAWRPQRENSVFVKPNQHGAVTSPPSVSPAPRHGPGAQIPWLHLLWARPVGSPKEPRPFRNAPSSPRKGNHVH